MLGRGGGRGGGRGRGLGAWFALACWSEWKVGVGLCGLDRGIDGGYIDGFPYMGERGGVLRVAQTQIRTGRCRGRVDGTTAALS
jgi:hypothetical protein